jgi:hypothetical protein
VSLFSEGRRFRFGTIGEPQVIIVMTGLGMVHKYQAVVQSVIEYSVPFTKCCRYDSRISSNSCYCNGNI